LTIKVRWLILRVRCDNIHYRKKEEIKWKIKVD
jgi:hypothetical protein